jgi:type VI secretion system protein ImpK
MFLIEKFQQFGGELERLVAQISHGAWVFDSSGTGALEPDAPRDDASTVAIWRKLLTLLEKQALEAGREGGDVALAVYRRAQYAMAALADETFLHVDWIGREAWRKNLLETRLFGTHTAGSELFDRIDELLRERDPVNNELARVYLAVLALGFQGKFRGQSDADQDLTGYRRRLFRFIFGREPQAVRGNEPLVPQTYTATRDERHAVELPYLRPWILAFIFTIVAWLAASEVIWKYAIADIEPLVREIITLAPDTTTAKPGGRV